MRFPPASVGKHPYECKRPHPAIDSHGRFAKLRKGDKKFLAFEKTRCCHLTFWSVAGGAEEKSIEQMITGARTPAGHEAITACYAKQAREAQKKADEHKKMKEWYQKHPALNKSGFSSHCGLIARK